MVKKAEEKVKLEEAINNWKRAVADYQNLEKRINEERASWIRSASSNLILRLLPILDTLMLAQKHVQDEGVALGVKQLITILEQEGVKPVETQDKNFDPQTMECVATESGERGKVLQELQRGYVLYDKILRPAKVKVGEESKKD
ncbi:nucleotide exchange factor GrpE [Candidatus Microgenomates bacterium]|nr:nucleotide exchange factor GrpE [Candidatus Microgenomates bacterium]MBI2622085.1 nucleotide exchange factor GrpE [Candidatus Microgenomates bacterium]